MKIGTREIGPGEPPYVIAEIGVNHDGEVARALELTQAAAEAGADAVKLQYFQTDRLLSKAAKLAAYQKAAGETDPVAMLRRLELSLDEMALVVDRAHELGIHAIVTVFSVELVKPASGLAWDAYKSASPDIVNYPLLREALATGLPLIASTGAASWNEVQSAYHGVLEPFADRVALLHCVSCYPTARENAMLLGMLALDNELPWDGGAIGYSDHASDIDIGALAVRIGASIIEKHITYDRSARGPDHAASLDPSMFAEYVSRAHTEPSLGDAYFQVVQAELDDPILAGRIGDPAYGQQHIRGRGESPPLARMKRVQPCERDVRRVSRQSVVATRAIREGETITRDMITIKRPCDGAIFAANFEHVIGRRASQSLAEDMPLPRGSVDDTEEMVSMAQVEEWSCGLDAGGDA